jgi:hypothetical protein
MPTIAIEEETRYTLKIGGSKHRLTKEELREVRDAINAILGESRSLPQPTVDNRVHDRTVTGRGKGLRPRKPQTLVRVGGAYGNDPDAAKADKMPRGWTNDHNAIAPVAVDNGWSALRSGGRISNGRRAARGGEPWTGDEDRLLRTLMEAGRPPENVARELKRSLDEVVEHADELALLT